MIVKRGRLLLLHAWSRRKSLKRQPDYGPALCVLGLIDAALGRKEEALREGRRAVELLPVEKDAVNGRIMIALFCDDRGLGWRQRPGLRAACQSPFVTLVPSAMVN